MKQSFSLIKALMLVCLFTAAAVSGAVSAAPPTVSEIVANVAALSAGMKTFQGTLVEERTVEKQVERQEYKFWRANLDRFKMTCAKMWWFILNGDTGWYQFGKSPPRKLPGKNLSIKNLGILLLSKNSLVYQFFTGSMDATKFKASLLGEEKIGEDPCYVLKIGPERIGGPVEHVWVKAKDWLPVKALIKSNSPNVSDKIFTIKEVKIDAPIDDSVFIYDGPAAK